MCIRDREAISAYTPADARGLSFGYTYTAIFGVGALGSSLAGLLLTRSTPTALFAVVAACAVIAAVIGGTLRRRSARRPRDGVTADD